VDVEGLVDLDMNIVDVGGCGLGWMWMVVYICECGC